MTVEDGRPTVERLIVDTVRWDHLNIDSGSAETLSDVVDLVTQRLESLVADQNDGRPLALRISITGRSSAHGELYGLEQQLRAEILNQANALGDEVLWIEKVCVETQPALDPETLEARSDAIAAIQTILERAEQDADLLESIAEDLRDLVHKSPKALIDIVPELDCVRNNNIANLVQSVSPSLVARLVSED